MTDLSRWLWLWVLHSTPTREAQARTPANKNLAMTRKQKRSALIFAALAIISVAVALIATALRDQIVYFRSPSELAEAPVEPGIRLRMGGLVLDGSIERGQGTDINFTVTDTAEVVNVTYSGILPDLFREGQGVIAEGSFDQQGTFIADTLLAKHDENYMPREVADALRKQGHWQPDMGTN